MSDKKYLAIGDIHGCLESLNGLIHKLNGYRNDYTFVFVGDYIDRGSNSKGVVDRLLKFEQVQDCIFLRGNHEQMLLDAYYNGRMDMWLMNGGKSTLNSYRVSHDNLTFPEEHLEFYKRTKMYFDTDDYFFVHAGMSPDRTIAENLKDPKLVKQFLWERSHLNALDNPWEKTVVFGHTPRPHPIKKPNMLGIDTGCVYESLGYGKLTAVLLPEQEFVQQICLDN